MRVKIPLSLLEYFRQVKAGINETSVFHLSRLITGGISPSYQESRGSAYRKFFEKGKTFESKNKIYTSCDEAAGLDWDFYENQVNPVFDYKRVVSEDLVTIPLLLTYKVKIGAYEVVIEYPEIDSSGKRIYTSEIVFSKVRYTDYKDFTPWIAFLAAVPGSESVACTFFRLFETTVKLEESVFYGTGSEKFILESLTTDFFNWILSYQEVDLLEYLITGEEEDPLNFI